MEHRSVGKMSLEETVYLLNQSNHGSTKRPWLFKIWKDKRVYIQGAGYNTDKVKQSVYIDIETGTPYCYTEAPDQPFAWIKSQNEIVVNSIAHFAYLIKKSTLSGKVFVNDKIKYAKDGTLIETHVPKRVLIPTEIDNSLIR